MNDTVQSDITHDGLFRRGNPSPLQLLTSNRNYIVERVRFSSVRSLLLSKDIIKLEEDARIMKLGSEIAKMDAVLDALEKSDLSVTFSPFKDVLKNTGHTHVVAVLENRRPGKKRRRSHSPIM